MSGIVLSASVRQNLLSLQSTASLLATTQNDLATGNKVNSALDNPTSYFTSAALNNRASDISNLLDGIGNGVQVLQAANTGITSLQSLVASRPVGRQPGAADPGRLLDQVGRLDRHDHGCDRQQPARHRRRLHRRDLLGCDRHRHPDRRLHQRRRHRRVGRTTTTPRLAAISGTTLLVGTAGTTSNDLATAITDGSTLVVNGKTITFSTASTTSSGSASTGFTIGIGSGSTATVANLLSDIDAITGGTAPR